MEYMTFRTLSPIRQITFFGALFLVVAIAIGLAILLPRQNTDIRNKAWTSASCAGSVDVGLSLCNEGCVTDTHCSSGLICYKQTGATEGVCRNPAIPSAPTCVTPPPVTAPPVTPSPTPSVCVLGDIKVEPYPNSTDWVTTGEFKVINVSTKTVTVNWVLDTWGSSDKDKKGSATLKPGEFIILGLGKVCSKWQLDIECAGQMKGYVIEPQNCATPTPVPTPVSSCATCTWQGDLFWGPPLKSLVGYDWDASLGFSPAPPAPGYNDPFWGNNYNNWQRQVPPIKTTGIVWDTPKTRLLAYVNPVGATCPINPGAPDKVKTIDIEPPCGNPSYSGAVVGKIDRSFVSQGYVVGAVTNGSTCSFPVGLATYKANYAGPLPFINQEYVDSQTVIINPGETKILYAKVPVVNPSPACYTMPTITQLSTKSQFAGTTSLTKDPVATPITTYELPRN